MWGQTFKEKDEGKVQGALSLWRKSARDFHRNDEEQENGPSDETGNDQSEGHGDEENGTPSTIADGDSETDGTPSYVSDGDLPSTDSRHRRRRGSLTRRR
jgi:hypothetical protein